LNKKHLLNLFLPAVVPLVFTGCTRPALQPYSLDTPVQILSVVGAEPVKDGRARFREIFCGLLANDPNQQDQTVNREDYLLRLGDEPPKDEGSRPAAADNPRLRILVVPGLFGECIAATVRPFEIAMAHLRSLGYKVDDIIVNGRSSSDHNADQIAAAISALDLDEDERLVLIGHSKGAVDILHFLVNHPESARRVSAVVSVAGAINGSPIAAIAADAYEMLGVFVDIDQCEKGDNGALTSLKRSVRLNWHAANRLPDFVKYFSLVAFTQRDRVNTILVSGYDQLNVIDPKNDGLLLFSDQVIPGARLLGYANADHWAVALPFEQKEPVLTKTLLDHNNFPRTILLQAMVQYVSETLLNP